MKHSNQKKANPNVLTRTKTNTPRNAFDMSHDVYMHSPVGMLIPSFVQDIKPNDYFTLDVSSYARTVPVNTAAFCRMTQFTDFYFVPMKQIWNPFEQMENPVPDVRSALYLPSQKANTVSSMPYITWAQLSSIFSNKDAGGSDSQRLFNVRPKSYAARLFDMLGYFSNPARAFTPDIDGQVNVDNTWLSAMQSYFTPEQRFNPYRILAFNRIINDYYRQTDYVSGDPRLFNIDDIDSGTQITDERLRAILRCSLPTDATTDVNCIFPFVKWNLDKLTATKPSQLYGSFTSVPSDLYGTGNSNKINDPRNGVSVGYPTSSSNYYSDTQSIRRSCRSGHWRPHACRYMGICRCTGCPCPFLWNISRALS